MHRTAVKDACTRKNRRVFRPTAFLEALRPERQIRAVAKRVHYGRQTALSLTVSRSAPEERDGTALHS